MDGDCSGTSPEGRVTRSTRTTKEAVPETAANRETFKIAVSPGGTSVESVLLPVSEDAVLDVEVLMGKFRTCMISVMDEKISTIVSSMEDIRGEIRELRKDLEEKIASVESRTSRLESTQSSTTDKLRTLQKQLDTQKAQQNSNTEAHRKVQSSLQVHDMTLKNLNNFLGETNAKARKAEELAEKVRSEVSDTIRDSIKNLEASVTFVSNALDEIQHEHSRKSYASVASGSRREVTQDESSTASRPSTYSPSSVSSEEVREMIELREKANNVVIFGLPEDANAPLRDMILRLSPDLKNSDVIDAFRIGRPDQSSGNETRPRLVLAKLTATGKRLLLRIKLNVKYGGERVYINHDLTKAEQKRRNKVLPVYKQLRAKGVVCSLPRDVILQDGRDMTSDDIEHVLGNTSTDTPAPLDDKPKSAKFNSSSSASRSPAPRRAKQGKVRSSSNSSAKQVLSDS